MQVVSFKATGLAQLSYLVSSQGEAFIVDPQRDIAQYLDEAARQNVSIQCVIETHRNEDFISGAAALGEDLDIPVYHGINADAKIEYAQSVQSNDTVSVGALTLTVIETPGHTKDSICISVSDNTVSDEPVAIFTGDTLFVNEVGRTDFYPDEKEHVAGLLYDSLQKLFDLPETVIVYPAHGAGSVCGAGMADREFTTLGYERRHNPAWSVRDRQAFIDKKLSETHYYAPYFEQMERYNSIGQQKRIAPISLPRLPQREADAVYDQVSDGEIQLLDVRAISTYCTTHIKGSVFLPGGLASAYGGWFLQYDKPIIIVCDESAQAYDTALQLQRMGYSWFPGYVTALPVMTGENDIDHKIGALEMVSAATVAHRVDEGSQSWRLLDVRKQEEVNTKALPHSEHLYLGHLFTEFKNLDSTLHYTCFCGSGMRATVAASFLEKQGFHHIDVFQGSMAAWTRLHKDK